MRNQNVIMAWMNGEKAKNGTGSLTTDGSNLLSYDLVIGNSYGNGHGVIFDYTASGEYYSQTTSCHVGLALRIASGFGFAPPPEQAELRMWEKSPRPAGVQKARTSPRKG
jgi:hypothetical protein